MPEKPMVTTDQSRYRLHQVTNITPNINLDNKHSTDVRLQFRALFGHERLPLTMTKSIL